MEIEENRDTVSYSIVIYFVKPKDTLWEIAKKFRSTVEDIARVNGIEDVNKIYPGQQLFILQLHTKIKRSNSIKTRAMETSLFFIRRGKHG